MTSLAHPTTAPRSHYGVTPLPLAMRSNTRSLRQNHLLEALPDDVWGRLSPSLELVQLGAGKLLHGAGIGFETVYFPTQAVISVQYAMKNGDASEVARIGYEGCCGLGALMGGDTAPSRAIVQHGGYAFRVRASVLLREFELGGVMTRLLLRSAQALLGQTAQTALCNRHHRVEQQLCRWLLISLDRMPGSELAVTHEWIAGALGVRRESVTQAILKLRSQGLIANGRNSITVLDRPGLEAASCECYGAIKHECDRLAPDRHAVDGHEHWSNGRTAGSAHLQRSYAD